MLKETFEQPIGTKNEDEMSQEERDGIIEEKEVWLQGFMDRALEKLNSDFEEKLISKEEEGQRYSSLLQINKEIASADEDSKAIDETLTRLEELGNKLRNKIAEWTNTNNDIAGKEVASGLSYNKTAGNKKRKIGVGLFRMRSRGNRRRRDYKKSPMPPAL
ncbi:MAG: hypothetical protein Q8Q17_01760 [bacterium]|nr:hypothetical protein [bacterium]